MSVQRYDGYNAALGGRTSRWLWAAAVLYGALFAGCSSDSDDEAAREAIDSVVGEVGDVEAALDTGVELPDELAVGDCVRIQADLPNGIDVVHVDCDEAPSETVIAVVVIEDEEYPGEDVLSERAVAVCPDAFEATGISVGDGQPAYGSTQPTPGDWIRGERRLVCYATNQL